MQQTLWNSEDSFGNHLSAGYSEAKISQWQFQISSSPCTNTSADTNNPQFKMDDSAQRICWLGWYSLYYFVRDGKPITTNQIALCRPFLPLLSLEYTKQSSSPRVLEAQLWQCYWGYIEQPRQPEENTACLITHTLWLFSTNSQWHADILIW